MGDPAYEYRLSDTGGRALQSIKESVRLALFVEEFDYQCRVAPRGAYQLRERRAGLPAEVRVNKAFAGLSAATAGRLVNTDNGSCGGDDSAFALKNYYHIREVNPYRRLLDEYKTGHMIEKSMLQRYAEDRQLDATFDALSDDMPCGLWNMTYDPVRRVVLGKNKKFEGSLFFHVPETSIFGTVYMGEGTVNPNAGFEL
ncbi:radial spoke head protein 9 [Strigomonas culicis]|uniref:Radial spoke head protein 9 homolog n=1 Tax=Strigomonas culicis TaxID=28005 RepID=S9VWL2_9TRYP|nr:radial spoke head protein 9 [Strigomonas culicis]|eukprot:EPY31451.1 radial spoke head protein 9 [Strigomonas culicis]